METLNFKKFSIVHYGVFTLKETNIETDTDEIGLVNPAWVGHCLGAVWTLMYNIIVSIKQVSASVKTPLQMLF